MKDLKNLTRSRNARLNLARRNAETLAEMLDPERRPDNDDGWNKLFADARDAAQDIIQGVHEASAYNNALKD